MLKKELGHANKRLYREHKSSSYWKMNVNPEEETLVSLPNNLRNLLEALNGCLWRFSQRLQ